MNLPQFQAKWSGVTLTERSASQSHFNDLCALFGVPNPVTADPTGERFTFEKGAAKATGGKGWADVWKRGAFAWEYKGHHADLAAAHRAISRAGFARPPPITSSAERSACWAAMASRGHPSHAHPVFWTTGPRRRRRWVGGAVPGQHAGPRVGVRSRTVQRAFVILAG